MILSFSTHRGSPEPCLGTTSTSDRPNVFLDPSTSTSTFQFSILIYVFILLRFRWAVSSADNLDQALILEPTRNLLTTTIAPIYYIAIAKVDN